MPRFDLYIDLDPKFWHADSARDQRKADALRDHHYLRVRHSSLLNRPGMSGDSKPWEGWSHVWEHVEEVPA